MFTDKFYNFLKYFVSIVMPAILIFWKVVAGNCDLDQALIFSTDVETFVADIWTALEVMLGAIFCIGNASYYITNKDGKMQIVEEKTEEDETTAGDEQ